MAGRELTGMHQPESGEKWDLPALPARRVQRQVHSQKPTFSEGSIGQELRPQVGRMPTARLDPGLVITAILKCQCVRQVITRFCEQRRSSSYNASQKTPSHKNRSIRTSSPELANPCAANQSSL